MKKMQTITMFSYKVTCRTILRKLVSLEIEVISNNLKFVIQGVPFETLLKSKGAVLKLYTFE